MELDDIRDSIANLLYSHAQINITGYEKTGFPKDFSDPAIGNVPFAQYQVNDPANYLKFSIRNYFLSKFLDKVRPGGILVFIYTYYGVNINDFSVRNCFSFWKRCLATPLS